MPKKKVNSEENDTRIRVDEERLNDYSSLDVSFLDKKAEKKASEDERVKEKILEDKGTESAVYRVFKVIFWLSLILGLSFALYYFFVHSISALRVKDKEESKPEEIVEKREMDDNYLFVGGFHTNSMNFELFSAPYVQKSTEEMTTKDILENMNDLIYIYNPSDVILEVGLQDLLVEENIDTVIEQIMMIVKEIEKNRPMAHIYVESLYPVNDQMENYPRSYQKIDNALIQIFNQKLMEKLIPFHVSYIDLFSILSEDGVLKESYTDDGLHLNEIGYEQIWKALKRVIHS